MENEKKRGRPLGKVGSSFLFIKLKNLKQFFADEASICLSKNWLLKSGYQTTPIEKVQSNTIEIEETQQHQENKLTVEVKDFNKDEFKTE